MVSKELHALVQHLREQPPPPDGASLQEIRAGFEAMAPPVPADIRQEPVTARGVPAAWISPPQAAAERVIFYLHGGAFVMGSITSHAELVARLARAAMARALSLDYRLAPEHPFPAAVDDATSAYRWLLSTGVRPEQVVVAGDSSGGGLALATLVALRDAGAPLPAAGVCLSPWVDLECVGESMTSKAAVDPLLQHDFLSHMAQAYLSGADPRSPVAAPLYADLTGLPPLLIQVGTNELLLDDATRLAERARAAGVVVTLEPWEEMIHVWQFFPMLPESQQAIDHISAFIRQHTSRLASPT